MATFGYLSVMGILVGYMVSTGFVTSPILQEIVIITIEEFLSNYVPLVILVTTIFSILNATEQSGAGTVYSGTFVYLLVSGFLDYLMMGLSWTSIQYVDVSWKKRAGPRIWPSVLYYTGIVDGRSEEEKIKEEKINEEKMW